VDSGGSKEACVKRSAHRRLLANTTELFNVSHPNVRDVASASSSVRSHAGADSRIRRQVQGIRGVYDYAPYKSIFYLLTYLHVPIVTF